LFYIFPLSVNVECMPTLSRINLHPIKALDAISVPSATVLQSGALELDRAYAIFDADGQFVNGKRCPAVHALRAQYDLAARTVALAISGHPAPPQTFKLDGNRMLLDQFLTKHFGFAARVSHNFESGYPDDTDAPGPTVISTATLETVASWFGLDVENIRRRFRANLEIGGVEPFWEDRLFAGVGEAVRFTIGGVTIEGVNPCQRCIVPTRDAVSGESLKEFQKVFMEKRKQSLPKWANAERFNHFYRLAVNTRIEPSEFGKSLRVGDAVRA
jgi:uncharacterized protein